MMPHNDYDETAEYPVGTKATASDDPVSSGLKLWANVGLEIGRTVEELGRKVSSLEKQLQKSAPVEYQTVSAGTFATGVPLVLNLGSPDQGTTWEVHSFAIGGTEANVTATGTWGLYVSGLAQLAGAGLGNLLDVGRGISSTDMPYAAHYGTRQVQVSDQENLFAIVFGGTNGQTYVANAQMTVFNVATLGDVEVAG